MGSSCWLLLICDDGVFCSHPANAAKNRYADVLCLEHSRVKLMIVDEDDVSAVVSMD